MKIIVEMQKEINKKGLYTSIFEYERTLFISQFHAGNNKIENVLDSWGRLAKKKIVLTREARYSLQEELADEITQLVSILYSKNAWWSFFRLTRPYLNSLIVVKTDKHIVEASVREKQRILEQYEYYTRLYQGLKNVAIKTPILAKKCRKYERLMRYWAHRKLMASSHQEKNKGLYTIVLEYNGDVLVYQFYISPGENINQVLKLWGPALREHKAFLEDEEDYILLEQKIQREVYELVPVEGLINVWSTYFMLKDGLGNIYVIKTDEEVMVEA